MADKKIGFQLVFPENLKKDTNLPTTERLAFDDLGDFIEERNRIQRLFDVRNETDLKVDYSDFSNHVFFDSAVEKSNIAVNRVLDKFPFNGNSEEKDAFFLTGSGYDKHIFDVWPRYVGYTYFDGTDQYISASDSANKLTPGSSSLYVSAWINPETIDGQHLIVQHSDRRSNLVKHSDKPDTTSVWTQTRLSVAASGSEIDPIGGSGSYILQEDGTASTNHRMSQGSIAIKSGQHYLTSIYAKAINRNWIWLQLFGTSSPFQSAAYFNLSTGAVGTTTSNSTAGIEDVGNGWYRCFVELTTPWTSDGNGSLVVYIAEGDGDITFDGGSQDSVYIFQPEVNVADENVNTRQSIIVTSGSVLDYQVGFDLYLSGTTDPHVNFDLFSGSQKVRVSASYTGYTGSFNNVSAVYDNPADLLYLYVNDTIANSASANLGAIDMLPQKIFIGSGSRHNPLSSSYSFYSGSLDEVRIFHTGSTLYHRKNYLRPVDAEDHLKLRYSFNESITGYVNVDNAVIDYSKSGLHGKYLNYDSSTSRVSGAVMLKDPGDPILYSFESNLMSFTGTLETSGSLYDLNNNNNIFNLISEGVLYEDDKQDGLFRSFALALARYFDEIKLYIDQFVNLRVTNYDGVDEAPDLFLSNLKRYFGWQVSGYYNDADPLSYLFGENILASGSLDTPLAEIRNQFWRRILNNLPLLMKSKGTRSNVDYLLNVLGLNKENVIIKEYGYLPGTSIQDERVSKNKTEYKLGIGTGSIGDISSSFVTLSCSDLWSDGNSLDGEFSLESMVQMAYPSASYSGSILSGGIWQLDNTGLDDTGASGSMRCYWVRDSLISESGKVFLEASGSASGSAILSSSDFTMFDGRWVHVAGGRDPSNVMFLSVRGVEDGEITISEDITGTAGFVFDGAGNSFSLYLGSNTSSLVFASDRLDTQGFFGEARMWDVKLSGSELDDHALNFQSVGTRNPLTDASTLRMHWALNENLSADAAGEFSNVIDLSRNSRPGAGVQFSTSVNPYETFLIPYNYLSPTVDLKWTENKVRVRNKTELTLADQATDTNEVSLEFSLVDALNEDIVKIFSTLDEINSFIGQPIYKYRDEYADLEGVRRTYFNRLGDSLNFTRFFGLFKWFDKKVSESIKQLLPARTRFIGGEQVVESHLLERPKQKHQYPVFRTPQSVPEHSITASADIDSYCQQYCEGDIDYYDSVIDGECYTSPIPTFGSGEEIKHKNNSVFFPIKVSGDTANDIINSDTSINFRDEFARKLLQNKDRDNEN